MEIDTTIQVQINRAWSSRVSRYLDWPPSFSGPIWPLVYRKVAADWWKRRQRLAIGVSITNWSDCYNELEEVKAVLKRQNRDHDVLDGRDVIKLWWKKYGKFKCINISCPAGNCNHNKGFVYVIAHRPFRSLVKIGKSKNPKRRLSELELPSGIHMELLGYVSVCCYNSAGILESMLHSHYAENRRIGEWFKATRESGLQLSSDLLKVVEPYNKFEFRFLKRGKIDVCELWANRMERYLPSLIPCFQNESLFDGYDSDSE